MLSDLRVSFLRDTAEELRRLAILALKDLRYTYNPDRQDLEWAKLALLEPSLLTHRLTAMTVATVVAIAVSTGLANRESHYAINYLNRDMKLSEAQFVSWLKQPATKSLLQYAEQRASIAETWQAMLRPQRFLGYYQGVPFMTLLSPKDDSEVDHLTQLAQLIIEVVRTIVPSFQPEYLDLTLAPDHLKALLQSCQNGNGAMLFELFTGGGAQELAFAHIHMKQSELTQKLIAFMQQMT